METRNFKLEGNEFSWQPGGNWPMNLNISWWKMTFLTILLACQDQGIFRKISCIMSSIPSLNIKMIIRPSCYTCASQNHQPCFVSSLCFIFNSSRWTLYSECTSNNLKKRVPTLTDISIQLMSSTNAQDSFVTSSVFTVTCSNGIMRLQCRFLRLVKHFSWYFASIAMRSPPTILASSCLSCISLIIVLRLASISYV